MNFDIPCEIFLKLAKVLNYIEPDTPLEVKNKINFVRLELKTVIITPSAPINR